MQKEPTVKDFLVYLVKKDILPKTIVADCKARREEALKNGSDITTQEILIEKGLLKSIEEYDNYWNEMLEEIKQQDSYGEIPVTDCYSMSENLLQSMIERETSVQDDHPDVPIDVIQTVVHRWKDEPAHNLYMSQAQQLQQQVTVEQSKSSSSTKMIAILCSIVLLVGIAIIFLIPHNYTVQIIELEIPCKNNDTILEGQMKKYSNSEVRKVYPIYQKK